MRADANGTESGLLIFKLISGSLARSSIRVEIIMDDMVFPSFTSTKTSSRQVNFSETGDAMVRELDVSRVTIRLMEKQDKKGEGKEDATIAKLQGSTLEVLQRCLVSEKSHSHALKIVQTGRIGTQRPGRREQSNHRQLQVYSRANEFGPKREHQ